MFRENSIKRKVALFLVIAVFLGFLVVAIEPATAAVPSACPLDLTHYWQLDETASPYIDFYGGDNATCSNCPTPTTGVISGAQQFTATSDVAVPYHNTFDWGATDSFSIEFWMKTDPASTCSGNQVFVGRNDSANQLHWWVGCWDTTGKAAFVLRDKSGTNIAILSGIKDLTDGLWHHIAAVRDAATDEVRLYVDGVKESSANNIKYENGFDSTTALNIGWLNMANGFHFSGAIDEVALYNRALTGSEIRSHYFLSRGYCDMCASTIKIMPVGDSITEGTNSELSPLGDGYMASYRQKLWSDLHGAGYDFDFVGSLQTGTSLTDPSFDYANEGHPGWTLSCDLTANGYGSVVNDIDSWLTAASGTPLAPLT